MNEQFRTTSIPASRDVAIDDDARRVLRNTWNLLAMTLAFSAVMAYVAMANNWPHPGMLITLVGYFGLLFLTMALRNSAWGLLSVFALTGFMGATLGPIIGFYVAAFSNGSELVMASFWYHRGDLCRPFRLCPGNQEGFQLSWTRFCLSAFWLRFCAGIGAIVFQMPALSLAVSAMFALLMCGLILFQTQQIIRGGERNYIMATVTLFVSIYNLFTSLLHLLGFAFGED